MLSELCFEKTHAQGFHFGPNNPSCGLNKEFLSDIRVNGMVPTARCSTSLGISDVYHMTVVTYLLHTEYICRRSTAQVNFTNFYLKLFE